MIRAGIIGGAGYTAGELIRLLINHPQTEIAWIHSTSNAGNPVTDVHGGLFGETDLKFSDKHPLDETDVVFLCSGHGKSSGFWQENALPENVKVIDLAQDFRDESCGYVYGLPEVNRDRMLYVENGTEVKAQNSWSRGNMSVEAVRECFYSLKTPEAACAWATRFSPLSLPGKQMFRTYTIYYTDPGFWKIYAFSFLEGKPFSEADFSSAIPQAVVCESVAKQLYGTTQVVGKPVIIDRMSYTICGVVKDVSRAADTAYGQVWTPYTTNRVLSDMAFMENMSGAFNVCLLARETSGSTPSARN